MLFPVSGTKIFIGTAETAAEGDWLEIGETEAIGTLGVQWQTQEITIYDEDEIGTVEIDKTARSAAAMQIVMAADSSDPGQIRLWEAVASIWGYRFRLLLPSGEARSFSAIVTSLVEVFDSANSAIRLQADLQPDVASYHRSEAI